MGIHMMQAPGERIEVLDESGRLIGVITRPVVTEALGPGREKVYLARPAGLAGADADHNTPHAA